MNAVMTDVQTRDLLPGDIVVRNDEPAILVTDLAEAVATLFHSDYVTLVWTDRPGGRLTWETTAQMDNTWPVVIREVSA